MSYVWALAVLRLDFWVAVGVALIVKIKINDPRQIIELWRLWRKPLVTETPMPPINHFASHSRGLTSPATRHYMITPSDTLDLSTRPRVLYCAAGGTAAVRDADGVTLSYMLETGQILPVSAVRVLATGTTATLYGWW